ncbi:unnamed protein product [Amaranthus hypochondriacus]
MTLLEQIKSSNTQTISEPQKYPFTLSTQDIIPLLKPKSDNPDPYSPLQPLTGFQISKPDSKLIESNSKFFKKLNRLLKSPYSLSSSSFIELLNSFLEKIGEIKFGGLEGLTVKDKAEGEGYSCRLLEKLGSFVGRDVIGLIIEGCFVLGNWEILKTLIVNKLVIDHGVRSDLLCKLVCKGRCDFICLCLRNFTDLESSDLVMILKCFLSPSKDGGSFMNLVRNDWETEATNVIEKLSEKKLSGKKLGLAKEAALLLMLAYDQFSSAELCMHFLLSSSSIDEVVFSSALSKLNVEEMMGFIRYLGRWLSKYERFPQVGPCPKGVITLGLSLCQWVPSLEDVVKCLGLVVDEHFSSLALHSEFHEELKGIEMVVSSLVSEGRLCFSMASLIEVLKPECEGA